MYSNNRKRDPQVNVQVVEFYGVQIQEDDIGMRRVREQIEHHKIKYHPSCLQPELDIIKSKIDACNDVYMSAEVGLNNNWYITLGKTLNCSSKVGYVVDMEMDIADNPTLSNDTLEKMKKLHELLEVNKPFESYELVHKIYHTARHQ